MADRSSNIAITYADWNLAPDEILVQLFSNLDMKSLLNIERVCKRWNQISADQQLWTKRYTTDFSASWLNDTFSKQDYQLQLNIERGSNPKIISLADTGWSSVCCVWWSLDGDKLAAIVDNQVLKIWSASSGKCLACLNHLQNEGSITSLAWSQDGKSLAWGTVVGKLHIWPISGWLQASENDENCAQIAQQMTIPCHDDQIDIISWSPDSQKLATLSFNEGVLKILSGRLDELSNDLKQRIVKGKTQAFTWSPDSRSFATITETTAKVWMLSSEQTEWEVESELQSDEEPTSSIAWSSDSCLLATGTDNGKVKIWSKSDASAEWSVMTLPKQHNDSVTAISWSPDGRTFITRTPLCQTFTWSRGDSESDWTRTDKDSGIMSVAWSPDRINYALWSALGQTYLQSLAHDNNWKSRLLLCHTECTGVINAHGTVSWSPDGKKLATAGLSSVEIINFSQQSDEANSLANFNGQPGLV